MTRQNAAVVKVTLGEPLVVTRGAMIAYQGNITFKYQGAGVKRALKAMGTSEGLSLMRCEGQGELFVAHGNRKLHLVELGPGEQMSASSRALLGFDATVQWDITAIKGGVGAMIAGGLFNVRSPARAPSSWPATGRSCSIRPRRAPTSIPMRSWRGRPGSPRRCAARSAPAR